MNKFVEELKQEHVEITEMLLKLKKLNTRSKEGYNLLSASKDKLLAHLKKEDEMLYPPLRKEAETNESVRRTLNIFAAEMESITDFIVKFYDEYMSLYDFYENKDFLRDISKFISTLKNRILKEEVALYILYEQLYQE